MTTWNDDDDEIGADSGGMWTPHPAGTYPMVVAGVFDVGYQRPYSETDWAGRKVCLVFESHERIDGDGPPYLIERTVGLSVHEKSIVRKMLVWAFGDDDARWPKTGNGSVNVKGLIGKTFAVTVAHKTKNGKTQAKATDIGPLMRGVPAVPLTVTNVDPSKMPLLRWQRKNAMTEADAQAWNDKARELEAKNKAPAPAVSDDYGDAPF